MNENTGIQSDVARLVRDSGSPDQVSSLAATVISLLNDRSDGITRAVSAATIKRVALSMIDGEENATEAVLSFLLHEQLTTAQIINECIPGAARCLGTLWVEDKLTFSDVTIGTARLQGLLGHFSPDWTDWHLRAPLPPDVVLMIPRNDDHTIGLHVAATQLRRAGATVRLLFGPTAAQVTQALRKDPTNVLMISASRLDDLAKLAEFVTTLRRNLDPAPPVAIGGVVVNLADDVADRTGADLATDDVLEALTLGAINDTSGGYAGHGPPQHFEQTAETRIRSGRSA